MTKAVDLTGRVFGRLTIIHHYSGGQNHKWLATCECGNKTIVQVGNLTSGNTRSCGCLIKEETARRITKNNGSRTRAGKCTKTYRVWSGLRNRCNNTGGRAYLKYGAHGITVDPSWNDFSVFLADMGESPPGMSLDRIDNNSGYRKDNCRWATQTEQQNNRRDNVVVTFAEITQTLAEWCTFLDLPYRRTWGRTRKLGWSFYDAIGVRTLGVAAICGPTTAATLEAEA